MEIGSKSTKARWLDTMRPRRWGLAGCRGSEFGTILVAIGGGHAYGQQEPAVVSGVQYLKSHYASQPAGRSPP